MAQWKPRPNVENIWKSTGQGAATTLLAAVDKGYEGMAGCIWRTVGLLGQQRMAMLVISLMILTGSRRLDF